MSSMELWAEATCELSHQVSEKIGIPVMHGHSYWVRVYVESSERDPVSAISLQAWLRHQLNIIDHGVMNNEVPTGTMEELSKWVAKKMSDLFKVTRVQIERKSLGVGVEHRV